MANLVPLDKIESKILYIRNEKVILDSDLAVLYEVETKMLVRSVKRNQDRFPSDFMFQLNKDEYDILRRHYGTSSWGGRRYMPYVFTEQGIAMLSGLLNSKKAIVVNIAIMRVFVNLRKYINTYEGLARKIAELEQKYDYRIIEIFKVLDLLMKEDEKPKKEIGFKA